jgi:hypothetical protein
MLHITALCSSQLGLNAELPGGRITILEPAMYQALRLTWAQRMVLTRASTQFFLTSQVSAQPGGKYCTRGQTCRTHKCHQVFRHRIGQDTLKIDVRIALGGYSERGAQLSPAPAEGKYLAHFLNGRDPSSGDERDLVRFQTQFCKQFADRGQDICKTILGI